jgi:Mg2+ and Co2+ transporter CorA
MFAQAQQRTQAAPVTLKGTFLKNLGSIEDLLQRVKDLDRILKDMPAETREKERLGEVRQELMEIVQDLLQQNRTLRSFHEQP